MLAKESKEAFENVRDDIDRQELRQEELASEATAEGTTMKNKIKDLVMEIAMIRQAVQAKDLGVMRNTVIDGIQRSQAQFDIANNTGKQNISAMASSKNSLCNDCFLGLTLLEARMADMQKAMLTTEKTNLMGQSIYAASTAMDS